MSAIVCVMGCLLAESWSGQVSTSECPWPGLRAFLYFPDMNAPSLKEALACARASNGCGAEDSNLDVVTLGSFEAP